MTLGEAAIGVVYVVDDEGPVRASLQNLPGSVGLRVELFSSAQEFLGRVPQPEGPSCLVLDVRMPGMSGLELQRRLAQAQELIPIIFITAHVDEAVRAQALREWAVAVLYKPFREEELLGAIQIALQA